MVGPLLAATVIGRDVNRLPAARGAAAAGHGDRHRHQAFGWMTRPPPRPGQALRRPGYGLQRVAATREPTAEELAVAEAALDEVLRLEGARPRADVLHT
jgi:hypothetical protein